MSNNTNSKKDDGTSHYTTQSGREVRKTGKKNVSGALA